MLKEIFSQILNSDSKTVNNATITLGDTDDSGKGRHFKSRFIQPGLAGYPGQYGNALIRKENLDKFVYTLRNKPVIINHKDKIKDDDKVGEVFNVWYNPDDGWYWCDGVITDKTAQNLVQNKKWSVSCSYDFTKYDDEGGEENGIPYDIEFLDGEFAHLAIVNNPRYERANIVFNSKTDVNNDKWVTIKPNGKEHKGRHLLIKDGETRSKQEHAGQTKGLDVFKEQAETTANKETKALETKTDLNSAQEKYNDILKKYSDAEHKKWQSGLSNLEYHKAWADSEKYKKELTTARREYAESIMANFEESDDSSYEDKLDSRRARYQELAEKADTEANRYSKASDDMFSAIPFGQPIHGQRDRNYRDKAWGKMEKSWKLSKKADYYEGKAASVGKAGISADDKNAIAKLTQKYKSGVDSAEKRRIIDRVIDIHTRTQKAAETDANTDYSDYGFEVERNTDINRLQLKFPGKPDANVRDLLKSNGFRWSPREGAWQRQLTGNAEYGLKRVVEGLKANNSKEQDMALIEELKKLITKVENNKGDNMIYNGKEDKRKLIDEVGGILEGKVDDEIIRTIIKKMEQASYNESEDGTADNKKVKNKKVRNEDEEDDKEVKNKKVRNEDEEDDKEVKNKKVRNEDEEDEDKVKEVKEDVKEDVENKKCNNSKETFFDRMNKIYNSSVAQPKDETYTSRADRLKAGEDYFKV